MAGDYTVGDLVAEFLTACGVIKRIRDTFQHGHRFSADLQSPAYYPFNQRAG